MCKWGTTKRVQLCHAIGDPKVDANYFVDVDDCIADIIASLNYGGMQTIASCCGHGNRPGSIVLEDGRELIIMPDYDSSRRLDKFFYDIYSKKGA